MLDQFIPIHLTMIKSSISLWHFWILILIQGISSSKGEVVERWIEQFQDHFDPYNGHTWWMRYYQNDVFYKRTGPIFIMIGGEDVITPIDIETGFMFEMAAIHGAILYHIEHRYYGLSQPVPDTTFKNLKYLSIEQALSDIAFFIVKKKEELEISNNLAIVFGNSYAGNLAAWIRIKYPELVHGAVAVSAPIYVKAEFPEYFEVIADSLAKYDENCVTMIKVAFSELEELLGDPVLNSVTLKNDFNICNQMNLFQSQDVSFLLSTLAQFIGNTVLYNSVESNGKTSIANLCSSMTEDPKNTSPYHKLAGIFSRINIDNVPSIQFNYDEATNKYAETSWTSPSSAYRMWSYQTCTELGYQQTFSSPSSIFGSRVSLQYFMKTCEDIFGENFSPDVLNDNVKRINLVNNAGLSNATNIIFINGDLDPWHVLSVLHDINDDLPAILIPDTTHCEFLRPRRLTDSSSLFKAGCRVAGILFNWIQKLD